MFAVARLLFQPTKRLNRAYIFATRCGLIYDREEEGFLLLASCLLGLPPPRFESETSRRARASLASLAALTNMALGVCVGSFSVKFAWRNSLF